MPFLRVSRDKRGYETTCLIHTVRRGGKTYPRILYCFRTPPHVRVGRAALDEAAIRAIEARYTDLRFDWDRIRRTAGAGSSEPEASSGGDRGADRPPRRRRRPERPANKEG